MKQNRKGFSLVELIVVLVIMAIIAALCAPNISAYVQAAKIQNYQTVANNLADELQTQLPQSRYWNWDEVKQSAEGILRSDAGRGVTLLSSSDTEEKYQVTGASSDANAVFTVTLTYQPADKTSQKVDVAVSCDGYAAAKAEQSCSLVLKTNYTDAGAYPMSNTVTESKDSGWGDLKNRIKTDNEWKNLFANDENYKKYDFGVNSVVGTQDSDRYIINTTDYPINAVKFVQYGMQFKYDGQAVYPIMQAQAGTINGTFGSGGQYNVCGNNGDFKNVYIYVGSKSNVEKYKFISQYEFGTAEFVADMNKNDWYSYCDVIDVNNKYQIKTDQVGEKFSSTYNIDIDKIIYRTYLRDADTGYESSRGWIVVTGGVSGNKPSGDAINVDPSLTMVYFDTTAKKISDTEYKQPTIYGEKVTKLDGDGSTAINTSIMKKDKDGTYTYNGYKVVIENGRVELHVPMENGKDFRYNKDWSNGGKVGKYDLNNNLIEYVDASNLNIPDGYNSDWAYLENHEWIFYYEGSPFVIQYYKHHVCLDLYQTGYKVGSTLQLKVRGVDASKLQNTFNANDVNQLSTFTNKLENAGGDHNSGGYLPGMAGVTIEKVENEANTAIINIPWTWDTYPYVCITYSAALSSVGAEISMKWIGGNTTTSTTTTNSYTPMLTLNGDNTYTNITLDWTKCDYITNVGEVGIQFDKYPSNLKYDVYSKDYTQLASGQSLSKFMMNSNSAVTPSAAADKIVHLYCKGLSSEDISCSIVAPSAPITTDTTTTTTTTTTTSAETETTAKTTSAAETTSTTTSSTTTTTTSATTTTSTTTSTTTETSTTTSTTTTATTSSTTTSAATTSTVTSTSAVTSFSVSTSSTSTSATTSTTTSITATTTTSATETSGSVVTTVVTGVNNYQVLTIPNYKLLSKVEFEFAGENAPVDWDCHFTDSNGWNDTFSKTFRTDDLVNNKYQIDCENINQQGYLKIGTYTRQPKMSIKSVTFYYRNPNVIITNKLPDGYAVDKASGTALLNSSYEFTVTWNPEEYRTPTVKWNGVTMIPVNKEDDKATYAGKIDGDVEIVVSGRKEDLSGNTLVIDDFNYGTEYDISKYWYIDEDGNGQIPKEIQVEFSDGSYNLRAVLSADKFKTTLGEGNGIFEYCASKNSNGGETYVISSDVISKISMIKNAKIKFENWGSNAKVEAIKFVYADNSELAKAVRYMSRKENIAAILDSELSHHAVTTSARETSFTTTPQTTTTTTTTTTAKPIAASENGKNVGLDETSAAGCDITFSESLFNESGVCYFTITPKAGYTLSDGYTVKVGTEVLSPKNNYNPKTGQWFFWSNKSMTDYTIHVEGISPAA